MRAKFLGFLILLTIGVLVSAPAYAELIALGITDGTNTVIIVDEGAGDSWTGTPGLVGFNGAVGDWNINSDLGTGSELAGPGALDLTYNAQSTLGTTSTLSVFFTQIDTAPEFPGWIANLDGNFAGGIDEVSFSFWADDANGAFQLVSQIGNTLTFTSSPTNGVISGGVSVTSPYSLTMLLQITGDGDPRAIATGDILVTPVPEPTGLLLLGTGLTGIAFLVRRRRK